MYYSQDLVCCVGGIVSHRQDVLTCRGIDIREEPVIPCISLNPPCKIKCAFWALEVHQPGLWVLMSTSRSRNVESLRSICRCCLGIRSGNLQLKDTRYALERLDRINMVSFGDWRGSRNISCIERVPVGENGAVLANLSQLLVDLG